MSNMWEVLLLLLEILLFFPNEIIKKNPKSIAFPPIFRRLYEYAYYLLNFILTLLGDATNVFSCGCYDKYVCGKKGKNVPICCWDHFQEVWLYIPMYCRFLQFQIYFWLFYKKLPLLNKFWYRANRALTTPLPWI